MITWKMLSDNTRINGPAGFTEGGESQEVSSACSRRLFKHALTRTVTEMDNVLFTAITHNPQPLHLDAEFAKKTEFGERLVNSIYTLGLVIGVSVSDTTLGTTIGNLGMTDCRFANPVFHGDTITCKSVVKAMRESKSRPTAGLVVFEHYGFNQREQEVAYCARTALMNKKPT